MSERDDEQREPPAATAEELAEGLRFVHTLEMQTRRVLSETAARIQGLVGALSEGGVLEGEPEAVAEPAQHAVRIEVSELFGKYFLRDLPETDCASRVALCKATCCTQSFPLGFEDLDEGALRWDYGRPYLIRQRPDGRCVHNDAESLTCAVYAKRPCRCRTYDCREDPSIWVDFEGRVPNPELR